MRMLTLIGNWLCNAQKTTESQRLLTSIFLIFKLSDSRSAGWKRILTWNIHFVISYRPTIGCISLYIVAYRRCCISEVFKDVATQIAENSRRQQPQCRLTSPTNGTPANIRMNLIFPKTRVIGLHFCRWSYGSVFIQICAVGSKRLLFSATEGVLAVKDHSGSSKVDDFGTNRKHICDFLLMINSKNGPILHHFRDAVTYWLKITHFF